MSKEPKVIRLNAAQNASSGIDKGKLSQLMSSVRDQVLTELEELLNKMMDSADDKLFDMADKSTEVIFFHSMRQLRIKRGGFIQRYKQEIEHYFHHHLSRNTYQSESENVEELSLDNFSLLKTDDLEENLAIEGMVAKAKTQNNTALTHLETRLDVICPTVVISAENNPLDPKFICESFRTASELLDLDIECRLVIYKLFERFVVTGLSEIYNDVNNLLADKGVLPDLHNRKPTVRQSSQGSMSSENYSGPDRRESDNYLSDARPVTESSRENIREEVFNTIQELLSDRKAVHHQPQLVDTRQLVSALTHLQNDQGDSSNDLTSPEQFRQVLGGYLPTTGGTVDSGTIGNANDDVIDIVSMMFDFILEDKNLHNELKALISRLQIPMLKVGLVDRKFFSSRNHPARILLNELARAGIGWSPGPEGYNDPLLNKISEIVETISTDFTDNIDLFEKLHSDFEQFQHSDARRVSIIEQRMREAEEGKAKANNARQKVNSELSRICHSRVIPEPVKQILKEAWTNVLFLEYLKPNKEGWEKALKVAEFLVWSVQPKTGLAAEEKLKKVMPSLVRNLKLGMDKISFSSHRTSQLLEELEVCHRKILHVVSEHQEQAVVAETVSGEKIAKISAEAFKEIGETATQETIQELSFPAKEPEREQSSQFIDTQVELADDDPVFEQIEQLQAGAWIELVKLDDERQRCKLAAFIASTERYIFVSRTGMKVAEFCRRELATAIKQEVLFILDDAALFDRALESVITNLRTMKDS